MTNRYKNFNEKTDKSKNKGVTVESDTFNKTRHSRQDRGEAVLREDLENVIDSMGPNTPQHYISSDADNEDSKYSASVYSSLIQIKTVKNREFDDENLVSITEDSQMTALNISDIEQEILATNEAAIQTDITYQPPMFSSLNMPPYGYPVMMMPPPNEELNRNRELSQRKSFLSRYLGMMKEDNRKADKKPLELYKIEIQKTEREHSPPKRLVFDLIDVPPCNTKNRATNTCASQNYRYKKIETKIPVDNYEHLYASSNNKKSGNTFVRNERMDIYYFDHGNSSYFRTTDSPPVILTERVAEKTEYYTTKFWAQIFGTLHIGVSFVTSFILQLIRFILHAIIRPLTVGLIQLVSDYLLKPLLTVLFNGVIQPPIVFLYNIATSLRDFIKPISESVGFFIREIAVLFKSFRFVQIDKCKHCPESKKAQFNCT